MPWTSRMYVCVAGHALDRTETTRSRLPALHQVVVPAHRMCLPTDLVLYM